MNVSRKFLWTLALALMPVLSIAGFAAPPQGGYGEGAESRWSPAEQLRQLTKALDLTADQQAKLKPILIEERKKTNAVRDDTTLDRRAMLDKIAQIRQDAHKQIRTVLDEKQKDKFDKMQQPREHRAEPAGQGGDDSGGNAPAPAPAPQN